MEAQDKSAGHRVFGWTACSFNHLWFILFRWASSLQTNSFLSLLSPKGPKLRRVPLWQVRCWGCTDIGLGSLVDRWRFNKVLDLSIHLAPVQMRWRHQNKNQCLTLFLHVFLSIRLVPLHMVPFFFFCVFARTSQRAGQTTSPNTSCKALKLTYKKGTRTLPSEVALPARKTNSEESASACQNRPATPEGRKAKPSSTQEQQRATKRSAKKPWTPITRIALRQIRKSDTNSLLHTVATESSPTNAHLTPVQTGGKTPVALVQSTKSSIHDVSTNLPLPDVGDHRTSPKNVSSFDKYSGCPKGPARPSRAIPTGWSNWKSAPVQDGGSSREGLPVPATAL